MKKHYYLVSGTTIYDGLEFQFKYVCEEDKPLSSKQAEKNILSGWLHEDTGEELDGFFIDEISKEEYEVFKKYHL